MLDTRKRLRTTERQLEEVRSRYRAAREEERRRFSEEKAVLLNVSLPRLTPTSMFHLSHFYSWSSYRRSLTLDLKKTLDLFFEKGIDIIKMHLIDKIKEIKELEKNFWFANFEKSSCSSSCFVQNSFKEATYLARFSPKFPWRLNI
jgi:hypothetical protein